MLSILLGLILSALPHGPPGQVEVLRRYADTHASQGVAVDSRSFYAVSNSAITRFDKQTGARLAQWKGDPGRYPHINSCAVIGRDLVCASSNYPRLPMRSTVEVFAPDNLAPRRSVVLADAPGSVTWIDRHQGHWWVGFANYDGWGGQPGRNHSSTAVVEYNSAWKPVAQWRFPSDVLDRFAPYSTSGGGFGDDGLLYVTGHDRPEIYALRAPKGGGELVHLATLPLAVHGQAFAWDHAEARVIFGVSRASGEVVAMRLPPVDPAANPGPSGAGG